MSVRSRFIIAALVATMLLAGTVGSASAGRFSVNEGFWHKAWGFIREHIQAGPLNISVGQVHVQCPLTLTGHTTERTIKKETATNQGEVTQGEFGVCEGGTATLRRETLPWRIRDRSFTGTLPSIRSISEGVIGAAFRVRESGGLECEAQTEVNHPAVLIIGNSAEASESGLETTGEPEDVTAERAAGIPLGGSFLCAFAGEGHISGVGLLRNLPGTRKLNYKLI